MFGNTVLPEAVAEFLRNVAVDQAIGRVRRGVRTTYAGARRSRDSRRGLP
jgi:hypothetical protein